MDHLLTEARNPASSNLDELTPLELVRLMNSEDRQVPLAVATQAEVIACAIEVIADRLRQGGRLIYAGAGTSGRLGVVDAAECPPTFNSPPGQVVGIIAGGTRALTQAVEGAEDHPEFAEEDLRGLDFSARDVLVGIATSGRTPYVLSAVRYARGLGARTIGLSCTTESELAAAVDLPITVLVGPEILSGSTRLKAGTATKLVLNMLSTGAMVRLGKTFGNLMVDLRATNSKLRARTNRIIRQLTGLTVEQADELLQRCSGELKTALVVQMGHTTPEDARRLLQQAQGQVRQALHSIAGPLSSSLYSKGSGSGSMEIVSTPSPTPASPGGNDEILLLGIDGGGTHTVALLARGRPPKDWVVLGKGEAGPSNVQAVGQADALAALEQAIDRAFAAAGRPRRPVQSACLGLAGAAREQERDWLLRWADNIGLAEQVVVTTDVALLLAAGTPAGWGLAVVAGTGSCAWATAPDGGNARAGGWGYLLGDEGSGYAIALAGLQAVARLADARGPATLLAERILKHLGLSEPQDLVPALYGGTLDRPGIAALAALVVECADRQDTVAQAILDQGAQALAETATAAARRVLDLAQPVPLALAGGMFLAHPSYRQRFLTALARCQVHAEPITLVPAPAEGAVRLALQRVQAV